MASMIRKGLNTAGSSASGCDDEQLPCYNEKPHARELSGFLLLSCAKGLRCHRRWAQSPPLAVTPSGHDKQAIKYTVVLD